jgi:hypothetical protein
MSAPALEPCRWLIKNAGSPARSGCRCCVRRRVVRQGVCRINRDRQTTPRSQTIEISKIGHDRAPGTRTTGALLHNTCTAAREQVNQADSGLEELDADMCRVGVALASYNKSTRTTTNRDSSLRMEHRCRMYDLHGHLDQLAALVARGGAQQVKGGITAHAVLHHDNTNGHAHFTISAQRSL